MQSTAHLLAITICAALIASSSSANEVVKVSQFIWDKLAIAERAAPSEKLSSAEVIINGQIGSIRDIKRANRSISGTNRGTIVGGAAGQVMYLDKALNPGNNYLAFNHLGAALGSSVDKGPQIVFELVAASSGVPYLELRANSAERGIRYSTFRPAVCHLVNEGRIKRTGIRSKATFELPDPPLSAQTSLLTPRLTWPWTSPLPANLQRILAGLNAHQARAVYKILQGMFGA